MNHTEKNSKMKSSKKSKTRKILEHLQSNKVITPQIALRNFSHFRLAVVINRLRNEGFNIITTMKSNALGECYAEYKLVK